MNPLTPTYLRSDGRRVPVVAGCRGWVLGLRGLLDARKALGVRQERALRVWEQSIRRAVPSKITMRTFGTEAELSGETGGSLRWSWPRGCLS